MPRLSCVLTAISIPDTVFEEVERLVTEFQTSRSQLTTVRIAGYLG